MASIVSFQIEVVCIFSKRGVYKFVFEEILSFQTVFCYHKPPKRLFLQDYVLLLAGQTLFQPS